MTREEKKYNYIYKTTNLTNGKFYIGMHSTDKLDDDYLGSGKQLKYSIGKHGKENHSKEILEFLSDRESLREREAEIVNEDLLKEDLCMNLTYGGGCGWKFVHESGAHIKGGTNALTKSWKDPTIRDKWIKNISLRNSNLYKLGIMKAPDWTGKKHTDETKKKMSKTHKRNGHQVGEKNSNYGNRWIHSLVENRSIIVKKEELKSYIDKGWIEGKIKANTKLRTFVCKKCNITFDNKKKRLYCSDECRVKDKPNKVMDNFENIKKIFEETGSLSRAFRECGIAYSGPLFKKFKDILENDSKFLDV